MNFFMAHPSVVLDDGCSHRLSLSVCFRPIRMCETDHGDCLFLLAVSHPQYSAAKCKTSAFGISGPQTCADPWRVCPASKLLPMADEGRSMADIEIATLWVHPSFGIGQRLLGRRF